jgi:mRNA interferase HigB
VIIGGRDVLAEAVKKHRGSGLDKSLAFWQKVVSDAQWKHFPDLKNTWSSADYVPPDTVFDLKGNDFRVIALVNYPMHAVNVSAVLTHSEYNKWSKDRR